MLFPYVLVFSVPSRSSRMLRGPAYPTGHYVDPTGIMFVYTQVPKNALFYLFDVWGTGTAAYPHPSEFCLDFFNWPLFTQECKHNDANSFKVGSWRHVCVDEESVFVWQCCFFSWSLQLSEASGLPDELRGQWWDCDKGKNTNKTQLLSL